MSVALDGLFDDANLVPTGGFRGSWTWTVSAALSMGGMGINSTVSPGMSSHGFITLAGITASGTVFVPNSASGSVAMSGLVTSSTVSASCGASSNITLGGLVVVHNVEAGTLYDLTATNKLWLNPHDGGSYISPIVLAASNSFTFTVSSQLATRFWEVTGQTSFYVTNAPSQVAVNRSYQVSASNSMQVSNSAQSPITTDLSASNYFTMHPSCSNVMWFNVSASNSFDMTNDNGGIISQFYALSGHASWTFTVTAEIGGSTFGGATAQNSMTFTTVAFARVILPWQRSSLTLPPGGQLPHS